MRARSRVRVQIREREDESEGEGEGEQYKELVELLEELDRTELLELKLKHREVIDDFLVMRRVIKRHFLYSERGKT